MVAEAVAPSRFERNPAPPPSEQLRAPNARLSPPMNCHAKRLECVQLAGAVVRHGRFESGSELHALQTLRAIRLPRPPPETP
jgi:hypothetical protein